MQGHPNLMIGLDVSDDAAVYRLNAEQALVQTVDFFPPIVDDPYIFGAIAAANALSDVYAMGGQPLLALAIAGFPSDLPTAIVAAILQGGADKVHEAGAVLCGGHTVVDREPKYGLCVTGMVHPDQLTPKANAHPGDVLLLTKPLGTGVITTAIKRREGDQAHLDAAIASMLRLNRVAAEEAHGLAVHSATDITGFGLAGHAAELARNSGVGLRFYASQLPWLPGALEYARANIMPGGLHSNHDFLAASIRRDPAVEATIELLICDPQTSGGLLLALSAADAATLEARYAAVDQACWRIGTVVDGSGIELAP